MYDFVLLLFWFVVRLLFEYIIITGTLYVFKGKKKKKKKKKKIKKKKEEEKKEEKEETKYWMTSILDVLAMLFHS